MDGDKQIYEPLDILTRDPDSPWNVKHILCQFHLVMQKFNVSVLKKADRDAIISQVKNWITYQLHNTCTTFNANNGRIKRRYGTLFVKRFNYLVGLTSPNTILYLTGLQQLPTYEYGYVQHSFKDDFRFPVNLELDKEYVTESSIYNHNKLELELQRIKRKYNEWTKMSWDKKMDLDGRAKQSRIANGVSDASIWESSCPHIQPN
jgi:hypothetical protein